MKKRFMAYLERQGYSSRTPSGNPSTVYDYAKRIDRVCEFEHTNWELLAENIENIVAQYDAGGSKECMGQESHRAVINALKRFSEFLSE